MKYKIVIESEGKTYTRIGSKEKCLKYLDRFKAGTYSISQIQTKIKYANQQIWGKRETRG